MGKADERKDIEGDLLEAERERMLRLLALQRIANGIFLKWAWLLTIIFFVLSAVFSFYFVWRAAHSSQRFTAKTRLVYNPRQVEKIQNLSDKQIMSIIDRRSLKRRVGERLSMPLSERECLTVDLSVVQEKKPPNIYTLTATAPTWVGVVKKVNAYAEVLIEEYITYRKRDLENWHAALLIRQNNIQNQIAELESEETIAKGKAGVASPIETLVALNALISDQRRNLSLLNLQVANEETKRQRLEKMVGRIGPAVLSSASLIRQKSDELAEIDKEIAKLREIYTDINPKVLGKLDDRQACLKEFQELLRLHGIEGVALDDISKVEKAASELADLSLRMEVLVENLHTLAQEIADNEAKSTALTAIIPTMERLRVRRAGLEASMREFEDQISDIDFLHMSVANDLQQLERAGGAGDSDPLGIKNFALAIGGSAICTGSILVWILFLELMFGKVRGAKEVAAYDDVTILGSLPLPGSLPEEEERDVLGFVALAYCSADLPKQAVLVCRLPGVPPQKRFRETLDWSLTMGGVNSFSLTIVSTLGFDPPEDAESMINTMRKGSEGWFPVANRYLLAPTELQMLQADLTALHEEFDQVFIYMPGGLRRGGSFFAQLLSIASSTIILVGMNTTPRSELAYVRKHVLASGKPMMGLITGVPARIARKAMEAKK